MNTSSNVPTRWFNKIAASKDYAGETDDEAIISVRVCVCLIGMDLQRDQCSEYCGTLLSRSSTGTRSTWAVYGVCVVHQLWPINESLKQQDFTYYFNLALLEQLPKPEHINSCYGSAVALHLVCFHVGQTTKLSRRA